MKKNKPKKRKPRTRPEKTPVKIQAIINAIGRDLRSSGVVVYTRAKDLPFRTSAAGCCGYSRERKEHFVYYNARLDPLKRLSILIHEAGHWNAIRHYCDGRPDYIKYSDRFTSEKAERHAYVWGWKLIHERGLESLFPRERWVSECARNHYLRKIKRCLVSQIEKDIEVKAKKKTWNLVEILAYLMTLIYIVISVHNGHYTIAMIFGGLSAFVFFVLHETEKTFRKAAIIENYPKALRDLLRL